MPFCTSPNTVTSWRTRGIANRSPSRSRMSEREPTLPASTPSRSTTSRPIALEPLSCESSPWIEATDCAGCEDRAEASATSPCRRSVNCSICCCSRSAKSRRVKTAPCKKASEVTPPARSNTERRVSPRRIGYAPGKRTSPRRMIVSCLPHSGNSLIMRESNDCKTISDAGSPRRTASRSTSKSSLTRSPPVLRNRLSSAFAPKAESSNCPPARNRSLIRMPGSSGYSPGTLIRPRISTISVGASSVDCRRKSASSGSSTCRRLDAASNTITRSRAASKMSASPPGLRNAAPRSAESTATRRSCGISRRTST